MRNRNRLCGFSAVDCEVLKELRDCNAQLLQKLDRLEDRVTSELQGLRKPEAAPRRSKTWKRWVLEAITRNGFVG